MITTKLDIKDALGFLPDTAVNTEKNNVLTAYQQLISKKGKGNDFLGWLDLPNEVDSSSLRTINDCAKTLAHQSKIVVVIGIGGSYLGARAVIDALNHQFKMLANDVNESPTVVYAGNSMSEDYLHDLLDVLNKQDYSIVVISKSGTTTEPAIAFRILKQHCEQKYGDEASRRIVAITDAQKGALKVLANTEKYTTFVIPDNVGGRYSVLTPVGLLPIAIAGFNIEKLINGARQMRDELVNNQDANTNIAMQYALTRFLLYKNNKAVELLVSYEPKLFYFIEWFKQLFGESEGKENKGLFPSGAIFSTDLHSLGQYIQEGERLLFETVISIKNAHTHVPIPYDEKNIDKLNYLYKKSIHEINLIAEEGTRMAHLQGEVPNVKIEIPQICEETLGELIYFFEFTCALCGYLLNINPFDQPGVEAYKKNMFKLLEKPE